ncbi:hypothetical protein PIB30_060212 [Stylosanthes scabra]|uniref:SS18 N-terminal domain-containing protein n=1 Tax=Stylosanthes scabra TaxID=79078 RepID=A0ABU6YL65_9FABA|nr:hypothetical protein [Stylosanthes scabra]
MFNTDPLPPLSTLSTEMIQKYLEENKELIMATMDGQNQGKFVEVSQYLAKLQHNLTYLAKLADAAPQPQLQSLPQLQLQPQMHSQVQGQGIMQHPHQYHKAMSEQQQHDLSTSKLGFQINEQQQQHKIPTFFQQQQQHQLMFAGNNNSGYYQAQTKLTNLSDMPEINHVAPSDLSPVWSLTKSPSESTARNTRS